MARVKSRGNKSTELRLIAIFKRHSITGWRRGRPLFGKPDFVFPAARVVVFVDGCFWHGHPILCRLPATNQSYWLPKIESNKARDRMVTHALQKKGWHVLRVWEHEFRVKNESMLVRKITAAIDSGTTSTEFHGSPQTSDRSCRQGTSRQHDPAKFD
jgi:DNA mismatch endonuclease, patch repair protein